jgi:hypothetical protein
LVEIRRAFVEVELAALKKKMRVRIDEAWQESELGKIRIGRLLIGVNGIARRGIFAGIQYLVAIVNNVRVAQRTSADAIDERAHAKPDAAATRSRRNDG